MTRLAAQFNQTATYPSLESHPEWNQLVNQFQVACESYNTALSMESEAGAQEDEGLLARASAFLKEIWKKILAFLERAKDWVFDKTNAVEKKLRSLSATMKEKLTSSDKISVDLPEELAKWNIRSFDPEVAGKVTAKLCPAMQTLTEAIHQLAAETHVGRAGAYTGKISQDNGTAQSYQMTMVKINSALSDGLVNEKVLGGYRIVVENGQPIEADDSSRDLQTKMLSWAQYKVEDVEDVGDERFDMTYSQLQAMLREDAAGIAIVRYWIDKFGEYVGTAGDTIQKLIDGRDPLNVRILNTGSQVIGNISRVSQNMLSRTTTAIDKRADIIQYAMRNYK